MSGPGELGLLWYEQSLEAIERGRLDLAAVLLWATSVALARVVGRSP